MLRLLLLLLALTSPALAAWPGSPHPPIDGAVVAAGRSATAAQSERLAREALTRVQAPRDRALGRLILGLAQARAGRYRAARADLQAAAAGPLAIADYALFQAAEASFHAGDYEDAARIYRDLLKKYPRSDWRHRARFRLGDCDRGLGKLKQARQTWTSWQDDYPEYPHPVALRYALADVEHGLGQNAAAAEHLREILDTWPQDALAPAARTLLEGLKGQGTPVPTASPATLLAAGEDLRKRKFFGAALHLLQSLLTHPKADAGLKRKASIQIGRALLQSERLEEALATFEALCDQGGGRTAWYWRSEVLTRMGRTKEAALALIAASGRTPDALDAETREKLAWLAFHGGDYPSALKQFAELGKAVGPWMRAWLAWRGGRYKEAREGFLRLGTSGWQAEKHLYWAGRADMQLGEFETARDRFRQVYQRFPGTYYAWQARARLIELGHPPAPPVEHICKPREPLVRYTDRVSGGVIRDLNTLAPCDPGDGPQDPITPLQTLASGWGGALTGFEASLEYTAIGQERMATWHLRALRDELVAHGLSGRPLRWRYLYRPYIDNRPDDETRAEWGRVLDDAPVPSDRPRAEALRTARGEPFSTLIEQAFWTLGDHYYIRRLTWGDTRAQEPPEDPAQNPGWRLRYARAFRPLMEAHAATHSLDPHLLWAFMAVESSFNPWAVSRASARGLMQVMPHTGALIAQRTGLRNFGTSLLFEPELVIEMAAWYVDALLEKFDGQLPLAIAAYNAGPHRVAAWLDAKGQLPMDEFIEEIPYDEAREYTKKVLRHFVLYHRTYQGRIVWPVSQVIDPRYRDNINF